MDMILLVEISCFVLLVLGYYLHKSWSDKIALLSIACTLVCVMGDHVFNFYLTKLATVVLSKAWFVYDNYVTLDSTFKVLNIVFSIIYMVHFVYRQVHGRPRPYKRAYKPTYVPESMKPGSEFQLNATLPSFQCEVQGSVDGETYFPLGQAFLVAQGLVTAAHVIYDVEKLALVKDDHRVYVDKSEFSLLDGDIALFKIKQRDAQALGLSQGKLSNQAVTANSGLMAQIVAFGQRSFGFLETYPQFGYCSYSGSTLKGFSGAPYYINKTIFGMHLGGNVDNLGYEAAYILSVLRPSKLIVSHQEASDDWLIDQASRSVAFDYEQSPYDPDEYRVKMNGRYHMVEGDVLGRMLGRTFGRRSARQPMEFLESADVPQESSLPKAPRGALDYEPGNLIRAPAVVAGALGVEQVLPSAPRQEAQTSRQTVSLSRPPSELSRMEYRESMHAPPSAVSASTARNRKRKSRLQQLKSQIQQLSRQLEATRSGQLI